MYLYLKFHSILDLKFRKYFHRLDLLKCNQKPSPLFNSLSTLIDALMASAAFFLNC